MRGPAAHAEPWLGPEFLNILDSAARYHREPELLSEVAGGPLCWVRDALRESRLPAGVEDTIVPRWEAMAESLDGRCRRCRPTDRA